MVRVNPIYKIVVGRREVLTFNGDSRPRAVQRFGVLGLRMMLRLRGMMGVRAASSSG
jgi:hypothetical protein